MCCPHTHLFYFIHEVFESGALCSDCSAIHTLVASLVASHTIILVSRRMTGLGGEVKNARENQNEVYLLLCLAESIFLPQL